VEQAVSTILLQNSLVHPPETLFLGFALDARPALDQAGIERLVWLGSRSDGLLDFFAVKNRGSRLTASSANSKVLKSTVSQTEPHCSAFRRIAESVSITFRAVLRETVRESCVTNTCCASFRAHQGAHSQTAARCDAADSRAQPFGCSACAARAPFPSTFRQTRPKS